MLGLRVRGYPEPPNLTAAASGERGDADKLEVGTK